MTDIASLEIKIDATDANMAAASLDKMTAAGGKAEGQATKLTAAQKKLAEETVRVSSAYDQWFRGDFVSQYQRATSEAVKHAEAQKKLGAAAGLAKGQLQNLSFQLNDVVTGLASGQAPLRILAQQGGQVFQALQMGAGGVTGSVKGLLSFLTPLRLAIGGVAVVTLAAAAAVISYEDSLAKLGEITAGVGRQSGLAANQIKEIARQNASGSGASVKAATDLEGALLQTGKVGGAVFGDLIRIQNKYALATGQDLKSAQKELALGFADPAKGAALLSDRLSGLDGKTQELISSLVAQGRNFEAQQVLAKAYSDALAGVSSTSQSLGGQLATLGNAISNVSGRFAEAVANAQLFIALGPRAFAELKRQQEEAAKGGQTQADANNASKAGSDLFFSLNPDAGQQRALQGNVGVAARGLAASSLQYDAEGIRQNADALERATRAQQSYIPAAEKAHKLALLDIEANQVRAQKETGATRARLGTLAAQRAEIELSGQALTKTEVEQRARDAAAVATSHQEKASTGHAEALAREAAAMVANAAGALKLAEAYAESGEAAFKAESLRKAATDATSKGIDVAAQARRQLNLDIAETVASGAKGAAALQAQADAQGAANDEVQYGHAVSAVAQKDMQEQLALRPLLIAQLAAQEVVTRHGINATTAEREAVVAATAAIRDHRKAASEDTGEALKAANLAAAQGSRDQIALAEAELKLLGATNEERARGLALLQAEQQQRAVGYDAANATDKQRQAHDDAVKAAVDAAGATAHLQTANDNYNASLRFTLDLLEEIAGHNASIAAGLGDGLGRVGDAIGGLIANLGQYRAYQERLNVEEAAARHAAGTDTKRLGEIQVLYARKRADAEVEANLASLDSFKHLFSEKSGAYKVLTGIETAYQAIQLAGTIKAIALDAVHTVQSIGNSEARAAADAGAGAAKIFSMLGPFAFPVVAAMVATLAALGLKLAGGGGHGAAVPSAEDLQKAQGAGTVLGDSSAKSQSIEKALQIATGNSNKDLEYSSEMVRALRSIDSNIGALTATLARQLGVGGVLDTAKLSLGTATSGPSTLTKALSPFAAILPGLFGKKTTTTLQDQGLQFGPQSLSSILSGGLTGSAYEQILTETKKKFLGITVSDKSKTSTSTTPLGSDITDELTRVIVSLRDGVLAAAGQLGLDGAQAVLDAFQVNLGTISLKDLKGQDLQDAVSAIFSKLGDQMAAAVLGDIGRFQKAGEGAFETLIRLAKEFQVVDVGLAAIGKTFGAVGSASIGARDKLVQLFGGLDEFQSAISAYSDAFLTDAEKIAPVQAAVTKELTRLGYASVTTKDQFKALVSSIDTSTDAGADLFAALLQVAPAFAKVADYAAAAADKLTQAARDTADTTLATAKTTLTDAQGALRNAYQTQAADLKAKTEAFTAISTTLRDAANKLAGGTAGQQLGLSRAAFDQAARAVRANPGDKDAYAKLQGAGDAFLTASKAGSRTALDLARDNAAVRRTLTEAAGLAQTQADTAKASLDQLTAIVGKLIDLNDSVLTIPQAIAGVSAAINALVQAQAGRAAAYGTTVTSNDNFDAATYLRDNPDIAAAGVDPHQHYLSTGQYEIAAGLRKFATGGSFTVSGPSSGDQVPVSLMANGGEQVSVSKADTMAALVTEMQGLRAEVAGLRAEAAKTAANTKEMKTLGIYARGISPGDPVETQAA